MSSSAYGLSGIIYESLFLSHTKKLTYTKINVQTIQAGIKSIVRLNEQNLQDLIIFLSVMFYQAVFPLNTK